MNSSLEILSRRLRLLCSLILLYALSICISAAKFCVSETSRDSARAARFCVHTSLKTTELDLKKGERGIVSFAVSNWDEKGASEVRIEYDLIITLPKSAANRIELELYLEDQNSKEQIKTMRRSDGKKDTVFTFPRAGIFEAGKKCDQSYSLSLRAKKRNSRFKFRLNLAVSARQIFSGG